ncbi:MAG: MgtC family protein [Frankiales bacterium]|nr:MgtC family protein [Frankiales bacterium]
MTTVDAALRLLAAAGLGAALGLERELNAQPAGFRTHLLVSLGAGLFTVAGADLADADPARVAAQVVTGIGFLGAGAILREGGSVKGLTTAASLWVTAAVGLACGLGLMAVATIATVIAMIALVVLKRLEHDVFPQRRGKGVQLWLAHGVVLQDAVRDADGVLGCRVTVQRVSPAPDGGTLLVLHAQVPRGAVLLDLATRLRALPGVVDVDIGG